MINKQFIWLCVSVPPWNSNPKTSLLLASDLSASCGKAQVTRFSFFPQGQERFKKMSRVYYKGAMGALVVFDITNSSTLEAASEWKQDLDSKVCLDNGRPVPAILLANKCDMTDRDRDLMSSLDSFCKDNSFMGWFETSAKVCVVFQSLWDWDINRGRSLMYSVKI